MAKRKRTNNDLQNCKLKDRQQPKEKEQKDKQRSYKTLHIRVKTLHRKLDRAT
jgi:hypothetical protein